MTLGKTCYFYDDKLGVILSLAMIGKNLKERERHKSNNWCPSLCSWPPWLATVLSAPAGPSILLPIELMVGP